MLRKQYSSRVKSEEVGLSSGDAAPPTAQSPRLKKDFRVQVIEKKGNKAKVRDLFGNEGWLSVDQLY